MNSTHSTASEKIILCLGTQHNARRLGNTASQVEFGELLLPASYISLIILQISGRLRIILVDMLIHL